MLTCILATTLAGGAFTETWNTVPDRQWIGENWWANRLQDWEIEDGAVWCIEDRPWLAMRTAHLLTHRIDASQGEVLMEVDLLPPPAGWPKGAAVGVLLGCGSSEIDHRLTAQTHHVPAEDGGFLVLVDSAGVVSVRSFEAPLDIGGQWSISKKVSLDNLPMLDGEQSGHVQVAELPIRLRVLVKGDGLSAVVRSGDQSSEWISEEAITPSFQSGGVALVSHEGKFGFDNMSLTGKGVIDHADRAWGPVLCTLYTVDDGVLSMTAQFPPMDALRPGEAILEIEREGDWHPTSMALIDSDSWTATFRVPRWDAASAARYRIRFEEPLADYTTRATYSQTGRIPEEPTQGEFVIAAMNCQKVYTGNLKWNHNGLWMPHDETVRSVRGHQPDLIFFAGDQIYEGDLTPVDAKQLTLDYLYKWFRWCWSFGELTRDCPTVVIPDDHDVYHGNIWGAGGRRAVKTKTLSAQDSGGYRWPAEFVNMVHRTQTSHLPDPADPTPIEQGISVYYTDLDWGGLSCAILADRMFKSSPSVAVPDGQFKNGWPQAPDFDASVDADVPHAELLGERQERFLEEWASRSDDRFASVVLSQTPFCNLATLPPKATSGSALPQARLLEADAYPDDYMLASDGDSNGWPQTPRNRAVRSMAKASAIHICGDQHLGALLEYGVDSFDDGIWAFSVPAVSNTWPRRWFPPEPGENRIDGSPRYTGEFFDGFGNRMRVHAVANPHKSGRKPSNLHDRMPGYGIVRFDRATGRATFECWRRPQRGASEVPSQYPGWPRHN
ncbi:MAG: alkaline phosphatase D family protein [Phycisphaerales bacterium]|nr:alkaline phosphatase D family protein [Phycisphaerales bacterium]